MIIIDILNYSTCTTEQEKKHKIQHENVSPITSCSS